MDQQWKSKDNLGLLGLVLPLMSEAMEKAEALRLSLPPFLLLSPVSRPPRSLTLRQSQGRVAAQRDRDKLQEHGGSSML